MKRVLAVVAAAAFALTACSHGGKADSKPPAPQSVDQSASTPQLGKDTERNNDKETPYGTPAIIETDDGKLEVTASAPEVFEPSKSPHIDQGEGTPVKLNITIKNVSNNDISVNPMLVDIQLTSGGAIAKASVFDSASGVGDSGGVADLQPGIEVTHTRGYLVKDPSDVTTQVKFVLAGNDDGAKARFTN